jgi:hypothetical protein
MRRPEERLPVRSLARIGLTGFVPLLLHILAPAGFSGTECTTAGDDHGNCPSTATLLSEEDLLNGDFLPGHIEIPGDTDFFAFEVSSEDLDKLYLIETTIPSEDFFSDTFLRLIDRDGTTTLISDDNSGEGNGSKLTWSPEEAGTYYVEVTQLFSEDTGLYSLAVFRAGLAPQDDHGNDPSTGTLLLINDPPLEGSMEISGDLDVFTFIAEAGKFYDIETTGLDAESDTVISLYDSDGGTVLGTDDQGGREFNASRIQWVAPEAAVPPNDVFSIAVGQFLESKSGVGFSIAVVSDGEPIPLPMDGTETPGYLENPGDADAYVFSATKGHVTTIDLATLNLLNSFRLRLLDVDGISLLLEQTNLDFEDLIHQHGETGNYTVIVTDPYLGLGYSLSATSEASIGNPDLNGDGQIGPEDFLLLMDAYRKENPK